MLHLGINVCMWNRCRILKPQWDRTKIDYWECSNCNPSLTIIPVKFSSPIFVLPSDALFRRWNHPNNIEIGKLEKKPCKDKLFPAEWPRRPFTAAAINLHTYFFRGKKEKIPSQHGKRWALHLVCAHAKPLNTHGKKLKPKSFRVTTHFPLFGLFLAAQRWHIRFPPCRSRKNPSTMMAKAHSGHRFDRSVHWNKQQNNKKSLVVKFNGRIFVWFFFFFHQKHGRWDNVFSD